MKKKPTKKKVEEDKLIFLDLGCGQNKSTPDAIISHGLASIEDKDKIKVVGIDNQKIVGIDLVHDLTKFPYPFADDSIDGAFSSHFIEHLDGPERIKFFNEMYRILKMGGKMRHIHPHYNSVRAIQDPSHKWPPICPQSYLYWDRNWREANKLDHYLGICDYEIMVYNSGWMDPSWATKNEETRNFAINYYSNVVADLIADMKKR